MYMYLASFAYVELNILL